MKLLPETLKSRLALNCTTLLPWKGNLDTLIHGYGCVCISSFIVTEKKAQVY